MTNLTWDARNRLVAFAGPNATASFTYDALGRRLQKSVNGQTTQYLYDAFDVVQTVADGTPVDILQGTHIDEPLVRGGNEYYLAGALGSVVALSDSTGTPQDQYTYGPYGQTQATGSSGNSFQYTGREDDGTGLYYYRARYYSPAQGRFVSDDPLRIRGGDPNFYAYTRGNPVSATDPFGLFNPVKFTVGLYNTTFGVFALAGGVAAAGAAFGFDVVSGGAGAVLAPVQIALVSFEIAEGRRLIGEGLGEVFESIDEPYAEQSAYNVLGLLPFGDAIDTKAKFTRVVDKYKDAFTSIIGQFKADSPDEGRRQCSGKGI